MGIKEDIIDFTSEFLSTSGINVESNLLNTSGSLLTEEKVREFIMNLEENFQVDISDEEAEKLVTVGDIIKIVEKKSNKGKK